MSVPFKYRQHIRDMHESFHDGKPISEEEFLSIMSILCPPEHEALSTQYKSKCPLNSNNFLSLMYELQKATQIPYEDLVWKYIKESLKKGIFNGETHADLKFIRSVLDPLMRSVRFDVQNLYKEHAIPDSEGHITIEQLSEVFRAMYPLNQIVYIEMYKWARAKKIEKSKGAVSERSKAFDSTSVQQTPKITSSESSTVLLTNKSQSGFENTNIDKKYTSENVSTGENNINNNNNNNNNNKETPASLSSPVTTNTIGDTKEKSLEDNNKEIHTNKLQETKLIQDAKSVDEISVELRVQTKSNDESNKKANEKPLFSSTSESHNNEDTKSKTINETISKETKLSPTLSISEKPTEIQMDLLPPSITKTFNQEVHEKEKSQLNNDHQQEEEKQPIQTFDTFKENNKTVLPSTTSSIFFLNSNELKIERRHGLDFNPSQIRDMEPPHTILKNINNVSNINLKPLQKLHASETQPSWEYEEKLLDKMLEQIIPGKPVDNKIIEFLRELTKQERELYTALQTEMENLTSNLLACEVVEQRMNVLREQRGAQCFNRLEKRRVLLFTEMEKYVERVHEKVKKNKTILSGNNNNNNNNFYTRDNNTKAAAVTETSNVSVIPSHLKQNSHHSDIYSTDMNRKDNIKVQPLPIKSISLYTPTINSITPPLSEERRERIIQREKKLERELQRLHHILNPTIIKKNNENKLFNNSIPRDSRGYKESINISDDIELAKRICAEYPSSNTSQPGNYSEISTPRQNIPIVHRRSNISQEQQQRHNNNNNNNTIIMSSSEFSSYSPTPRQNLYQREVNPYFTKEMASNIITSSQVQHKIEERLTSHLTSLS